MLEAILVFPSCGFMGGSPAAGMMLGCWYHHRGDMPTAERSVLPAQRVYRRELVPEAALG